MEQPVGLEHFNSLVKQLAQAVYDAVEAKLSGDKWSLATLDVRYDRSGSSWLSKIRVSTECNSNVAVGNNNQIDLVLISLNPLRGSLFEDRWYGLKLDIASNREVTIKLNYDAACSEDGTFFDT